MRHVQDIVYIFQHNVSSAPSSCPSPIKPQAMNYSPDKSSSSSLLSQGTCYCNGAGIFTSQISFLKLLLDFSVTLQLVGAWKGGKNVPSQFWKKLKIGHLDKKLL